MSKMMNRCSSHTHQSVQAAMDVFHELVEVQPPNNRGHALAIAGTVLEVTRCCTELLQTTALLLLFVFQYARSGSEKCGSGGSKGIHQKGL